MKKQKVIFLSHLIGILFLIGIVFLTWAKRQNFTLYIPVIILLFLFIAISLALLHVRLIRLLEEVNRYSADSANQRRMLLLQQSMLELSNRMVQMKGINELLDSILKKAIELIPEAEYGSILVLNEENMLEFKSIYGFDEDLMHVRIDPKESYQWRLSGGNFSGPIIIPDLSLLSKDFMSEQTYSSMEDANALCAQSSLSAPLLIDGQFYGSINIDSKQTDVFTEEHKKLMAYFANQATIAIQNHIYYEKMLYLSQFDGLTGVFNRHHFQELIDSMFQKWVQTGDHSFEPVTFALLDLNHFKAINDKYGHASGDLILNYFAQSFQSELTPPNLFARYGGDEFIAVFFKSDLDQTMDRLKSIHEKIMKEPIKITAEGHEVYCLFSYGLAEYPKESPDIKTLLHIADQRMYEHKRIHQ